MRLDMVQRLFVWCFVWTFLCSVDIKGQSLDDQYVEKVKVLNQLTEKLDTLTKLNAKRTGLLSKSESADLNGEFMDEKNSILEEAGRSLAFDNEDVDKRLDFSKDIEKQASETLADTVKNSYVLKTYKTKTSDWLDGNMWDDSYSVKIYNMKVKLTEMEQMHTEMKSQIDPIKARVEEILAIDDNLTDEEKETIKKEVEALESMMIKLLKHTQGTQLHAEERLRSDGQSGIKQIRSRLAGSENYFTSTHTGGSFSSIHDHSNNVRTVGMGEFIGVLNGVQFRTRHNDYRLFQAATDDTTYHKTDKIEFPPVPPEVMEKKTVEEQMIEMREWFKAWSDQDDSVRDYKKYFRPVLTYLEGSWTVSRSDGKIDEPFSSDRHFIDAAGWFELQEKIQFTSYTGTKDLLENLAHLPTKVIRFKENNEPVFAQWNYRLLCHPISGDLPTRFFEPRYDEGVQRRNSLNDEQYANSRSARFDIEGIDVNGKRDEGVLEYNLLDSIMEDIPGKDNYNARISATAFDSDDVLYSANPKTPNKLLNAAYYHRAFVQKSKEGKVSNQNQRTFSDRLYVAETTSDRIAYSSYKRSNGEEVKTRVSFAIPVEVVYLTPLSSWNPYKVSFDKKTTGTGTIEDPFSAASSTFHYITPNSFFTGDEVSTDPADTTKAGASYIKAGKKTVPVKSAGVRVFFPRIKGIDKIIRQRYPIMPVHGEGNPLWKKLNAMEDALKFDLSDGDDGIGEDANYMTGPAHTSNGYQGHRHPVALDDEDLQRLQNEEVDEVKVRTEMADRHVHSITVALNSDGELYIKDCGTESSSVEDQTVCSDHHQNTLTNQRSE